MEVGRAGAAGNGEAHSPKTEAQDALFPQRVRAACNEQLCVSQ